MLNQEVYDKVTAAFAAKFGGKPAVVAYAPGRIEVLGNHTDYNEGFVFSAAIDKGTFFAAAPADDDAVTLVALDINGGETYSCKLADVKKVETGSTYYKTRVVSFPEIVKKELDEMLGPRNIFYSLTVCPDNAPMVGAGVAALLK